MPAPRGLVQQIDQQLHRAAAGGAWPRKGRLLVAVSGGADSVALLRLLVAINGSEYWGWKLIVGHVDHGLRGAASRGDARFVAALAKKLGLPFVGRSLRLPKGGGEDAARQARFGALAEMCRAKKCAGVVMAHHADDQAETVLMRIFRGCGIEGLGAISAYAIVAGVGIYRPLLPIRRAALREYLGALGQAWREDETNAGDGYFRNRVRRVLMPLVDMLWPRGVEALGRLAILAGEAAEVVREAAQRRLAEIPGRPEGTAIFFPRAALLEGPPLLAAEVLKLFITKIDRTCEGTDFERWREAVRVLRGAHGRRIVQLGARISLAIRGRMACLAKERPHPRAAAKAGKGPGQRRRRA